jgi:cytoplasmic iron level regulating protein YaaA (DUF328/UPF0246 family)
MEANLPGIGKVGRYWQPFISPLLNQTLRGRFVWDLLPNVHREAWDDEHTYTQLVQVKFFLQEGSKRKPITHEVKPLRGQLVNFIVRESVQSLEPLEAWEHPAGYRYDAEASVLDEETRTAVVAMVKKA